MSFNFINLLKIKGGLSSKKIFREIKKNRNKIIIDYSIDPIEFENFLNVYEILKKVNISIPRIYEIHKNKKIVVMEDFGDETFDKIYDEKKLYYLLKLSIDNLIIIQNSLINDDLKNLKKYSFDNLKEEIKEFITYYVPYKKLSNFSESEFYNIWDIIYKTNNFEFSSFSHKDYEFINLIFLDKNNMHLKCGIIDFQSAYLGFVAWDLLSVLENSRMNFKREYNEDLIKYFYDNININIEFEKFRDQYYLLNLARQTRLLGRWSKLLIETNDKDFLNYIGITKNRIISSLKNISNNKLKKLYKRALLY